MTWPRQSSATSELMPARDMRLRAVRRRSCSVHRVTPQASWKSRLSLDKLLMAFLPLVVKTYGQSSISGCDSTSARAALLNGRSKVELRLVPCRRQQPLAVLDLGADQFAGLVAARRRQQKETQVCAECIIALLGRFPHRPQLVIIEDAITPMLLRSILAMPLTIGFA